MPSARKTLCALVALASGTSGRSTRALADMAAAASDVPTLVSLIGMRRCIGIDGMHGVGKSTLATSVGASLHVPVIELDEFVSKNQGGYVPYVNYPAVAARLKQSPLFILEGICLLQVLDRLDVTLDCFLYVKRMHLGFWADERDCTFPDGLEAAIARTLNEVHMFSELEANQRGELYEPGPDERLEITEQLMRYHASYVPQDRADITFYRDVG